MSEHIIRHSFPIAAWALLAAGLAWAAPATDNWKEQGIIYTSRSPHAKLHPVPIRAVRLGKGFWTERMRVNLETSIPALLRIYEEDGFIDNFRRLSGRSKAPRRGPLWSDNDVYKWIEAVSFVLQSGDRPELRAKLDRIIDDVLAAQETEGYLNTYYVEDRAPHRFTFMQGSHELYCLGHFIQAAVAYYRATGDRRMVDAALKFENYLVENFGRNKRPLLAGHPEVEMALIELYRTTGDRRCVQLAGYILEGDGERLHLRPDEYRNLFSGRPFASRTILEGHAVRAMYACSGGADYYAETGDPAYAKALEALWQDLVRGKLYITGGVGARESYEAFGLPYELPNLSAYAESCAAIGNYMWNWRLLNIYGEGRFADVMERVLYNNVNSGLSLSGSLYCYRNPLEMDGRPHRSTNAGCCSPNLQRTFASLPGYFYSTSPDGLYVHLYHNSELSWRLEDGTPLTVSQKTEYPWRGTVELSVALKQPAEFTLYVRIPGWSPSATVTVNGHAAGHPKPGEYLGLRRQWKSGDTVRLGLDEKVQLIAANPLVRENAGRVAIQRGPLVYCAEQLDQKGASSLAQAALVLGRDGDAGDFLVEDRPDLLGGITVLRHKAIRTWTPPSTEPLYLPLAQAFSRKREPAELMFIPFYTFSNREPTPMAVWIPYIIE